MKKKNYKKCILEYKNQSFHIMIKKNKLSRNYKLTFDKKNLAGLVSIPKYVSFKKGMEFAHENKDWLYNEINKFFPLISIENNCLLNIKDKKMRIYFEYATFNSIEVKPDYIMIHSRNNHKKVLKAWFDKEILNCSKNIINSLPLVFNRNIRQIKITNSFNYWGSCHSNGVIHLNWRLIFAPIKVLRYIIIHEICHLIEFNHSKNFWSLVEKVCPDYKNQILWLKKNDNYLYRIRFS